MIRDPVERVLTLYDTARRQAGAEALEAEITLAALPWWLRVGSPLRPALDHAIAQGRLGQGRIDIVSGDAAACAAAIFAAAAQLERRAYSRVTVVTADTAIAPVVLDMSAASGFGHTRKTRFVPYPGEAAAAIVLSAPDRTAAPLLELAEMPESLRPLAPDRGLMGFVSAGLLQGFLPPDRGFTLLADLDGERHRAEEFGVVRSRLAEPDKVIVPALATGYIGTATLAVQIGAALAAPPESAVPHLCWTMARSGMRIAARIT
ncbi:hypothetical protein [Roseinatronobacter alkalisoli]|uniref:Uncharacterized protein n=1 Tax=Roseinatronobacter alkalisoli TaxID=3028235 RepID=A0ABT5TF44_9RHOB|nr:hypothetical protein [Roseinatronobacter sp. HJB301]MDD7973739.1 hypothetical protein [Roseinatronobacter sp. HJB301]